jgi:hypothetical protein
MPNISSNFLNGISDVNISNDSNFVNLLLNNDLFKLGSINTMIVLISLYCNYLLIKYGNSTIQLVCNSIYVSIRDKNYLVGRTLKNLRS